jgi:cardiolipin synthase
MRYNYPRHSPKAWYRCSLLSIEISILEIFLLIQYIMAFGIIFFERRNPTSALSWILVLLVLPVAGFFMYLFFGQDFTKKRLFSVKEEDDLRLMDAIGDQKKEIESEEIECDDPIVAKYLGVIRMFLESNRAIITDDNDIFVYTDGNDKFGDLMHAIEEARHHVHLQYYIIRNDPLGRDILALLCRKAREGVEVRLLYDAMGMKIPKRLLVELEEAGGRHAAFFPRLFTINYRNHRKIAVIDGTCGFIGGYNIGEEYLGRGPLGNWRDAAIRIEGTGVIGLQIRFSMDWNHASTEKISYSEDYFPIPSGKGDCPLQIVSSGPDSRWSQIKEGYLKLVNSATRSIYIQTPYFIPDESVSDALRMAALSGVDVRIMIPCKPDHPFVYWATYSFVGDLLETGVRGYTYDNGFIHAKTIVVDGIAASVGSANWDVRSFRLNFEANAFLYDEKYAGQLKAAFENDLSFCTEITPESYQNRPRRIKIKEQVSRLFSPLG